MDVEVFNLDTVCKITPEYIKEIVKKVNREMHIKAKSCNIIFTSDQDLAELHGKYLNDPSPTDVMTFNLGDDKIEGEIYISSERAKNQALQFNVSYDSEIIRLIVHGLLHLAGYDDLSEPGYQVMKGLENKYVEHFCD
jgi:probable rRNA maturation factor